MVTYVSLYTYCFSSSCHSFQYHILYFFGLCCLEAHASGGGMYVNKHLLYTYFLAHIMESQPIWWMWLQLAKVLQARGEIQLLKCIIKLVWNHLHCFQDSPFLITFLFPISWCTRRLYKLCLLKPHFLRALGKCVKVSVLQISGRFFDCIKLCILSVPDYFFWYIKSCSYCDTFRNCVINKSQQGDLADALIASL